MKCENSGITAECETALPSVPFHVKVPLAVPMLKIVTGICASALCVDEAVSVTRYQPGFCTLSAKG